MDMFILIANGKKEKFYIDADDLLIQGKITGTEHKLIKDLVKSSTSDAVVIMDNKTAEALSDKLKSIDVTQQQPRLKKSEKYKPKKLDKQIVTRDKLSSNLVSLEKTKGFKTVPKGKKGVYSFILLDKIPEAITPYRNSVLQRVYSFYVNRTENNERAVFSLSELYEEIYGTRAKTQEQLDKLEDIINFLWDFKVGIDVIAEYEARGIEYPYKELAEDKRISRLIDLSVEKRVTQKGEKIIVYEIITEPRFLKYARALNMYNEYPKEILTIKGTKLTEDRVAIRDALYNAVIIRKNATHNSPICIDKLVYDAIGNTDNARKNFTRYYDFAVKVLENFKAHSVIIDYKAIDNHKIAITVDYTNEHIINEAKKLKQLEKAKNTLEKNKK